MTPGDARLRDTAVDEATKDAIDGAFDPSGLATDVARKTLADALTQGNDGECGSAGPRTCSRSALMRAGRSTCSEASGGTSRLPRRNSVRPGKAAAMSLVTLLFEVARNYVEARGYQQRIAIAHQNIDVQQETLRLTQAQADGGIGSELDVAQGSGTTLLDAFRGLVPGNVLPACGPPAQLAPCRTP